MNRMILQMDIIMNVTLGRYLFMGTVGTKVDEYMLEHLLYLFQVCPDRVCMKIETVHRPPMYVKFHSIILMDH